MSHNTALQDRAAPYPTAPHAETQLSSQRVSSGAAVAVPFFYLGKLFGAKTVYIEVFDRIDAPTLTGKLVYPVTDKFVVQWEEMKKVYPKAINLGGIF